MMKKILVVFLVLRVTSLFAGPFCDEYEKLSSPDALRSVHNDEKKRKDHQEKLAMWEPRCRQEKQQEASSAREQREREERSAATAASENQKANPDECNAKVEEVLGTVDAAERNTKAQSPKYKECVHLRVLSKLGEDKDDISSYTKKESMKASFDGKITCFQPYSFTADFEACKKAIDAYSVVVAADKSLDLTQVVRTDNKNKQISAEAGAQAAKGDSQGAMFDSAIESNRHMKSMEQEKVMAYTSAVAALSYAHRMFPDEEDVALDCEKIKGKSTTLSRISKLPNASRFILTRETCSQYIRSNKRNILANTQAKGQLFQLITEYVAKGLRAGLQMQQYNTKAQAIAAAKKPITDEPGEDMMLELCQVNPQDPACVQRGNRISGGGTFESGEFSVGDGVSNSFNINPESSEFGEKGAETNLDDKNTVAGVNSPFANEAKEARDIINPAAAAQFTGGGANGGGGGSGGGGAGLGGSASLGSDLSGADKEGDKDPSIKTGKVSGTYNSAGGGGFKGVSKSKDDSNPFASLFDQKSDAGGVEEDRSIASGDIDGKASGLFEKISKRYTQIQADKRVEAKNLE